MKKGIMKKLPIILLLTMLLTGLVACEDIVKDADRFDVELKSGYGNSVEIGCYAPFYVEITNNGKDFEGAVQLIIPGADNHNVMYEKELSIQQGATKTVELVGFVERVTRQVKVAVVNNSGKEIWYSLEGCTTQSNLRDVNVGILSDDYSALSYMDHKTFYGTSDLSTKIFELNKDTMPSDWRALDMLDVMVITDYSTDQLSEEQLMALTMWVDNGGLLMVGTGSTSNKSLSALNGRLFDVEVGDLETHNTKYGLTVTDFNYGYSNDNYYDPYANDAYYTYYEDNFYLLRDDLEDIFMGEFKTDYGFDDSYDTWDSYWEDSFYWYCFGAYYEIYLNLSGEDIGANSKKISDMDYVKASVLSLSGAMLDRSEVIFSGDDSNGSTYPLAYVLSQGDGYVLLSCVDFTKTPLSNFEGNSMVFIHWVESLIGEKCYNESLDYSGYTNGYYNNSIDYNEREIFTGIGIATVPPILVYLGILFLYIVSILVVYLIFRHKKKTMNLWVLYPVVAAGLAVLIFCIGFSTRIYRPVVNGMTLIEPNGGVLSQKTYTSVTVPGNKSYEVGFSPMQSAEYMSDNYSSYYDTSDEIDWSRYDVGYRYSYESVDVTLGEQAAMSNVHFMLNAATPSTRNIVIDSENGYISGMTVTNNFGCKLENAALIVNNDVYVIGEMKDGDTIKFSSLPKETEMNFYRDGLGSVLMQQEDNGMWLLGLMLGSVSGAYDDYIFKYRALNSLTEYIDRYEGPEVVFVAIPTESVSAPIQGSTNYSERRLEVIYMEIDTYGNLLMGY
ncbi:MAG: hypothetical protein J6A73_04340 [Lachnospiraceae bacterium]|nr:hypothetical protein [Lachnospiraceae bacterium]